MQTRVSELVQLGVDVGVLITRGFPYEVLLVGSLQDRLDADAGVGLTRWSGISPFTPEATVPPGASAVIVEHVDVISTAEVDVPPSVVTVAAPLVAEHPSLGRMLAGSPGAVHRVSDVASLPAFWDTFTWQAFHGHWNGRYPAALSLMVGGASACFVGLHRSSRDFDDRDVAALASVAPPIVAALGFRRELDRASTKLRRHLVGPETFTRGQAEVLALVELGWTDRRIARRLGITPRAVRKRLDGARERVAAASRSQLMSRWGREVAWRGLDTR